jgi:SNF2 family DNA or RNA helicase
MELGYVLLEECCVDVAAECHLYEWKSVDVVLGDERGKEARQQEPGGDGGDETSSVHAPLVAPNPETTFHSCCGCRTPIQCRHSSGDQLFVDCSLLDPFYGRASEVICNRCQKVRSDLSALLGLIQVNKAAVSIHTMQILLTETSTSILVTLAFNNLQHHRCIFLPRTNSIKVLPASLQTLLMIVESNWAKLQQSMESLAIRRSERKRKESLSLFPSQLTISELYRRLENSDPVRPIHRRTRINRDGNFLLDIPPDVWSETLEKFLTVNDVNALRGSCRTLRHDVLGATVPGLKLRLYHHQAESLRWMRERERPTLTESEILQTDDCNLHRAVTGGLTVLLQARDDSFSIRLDAITGCEYCCPPSIRKPRNVARGGMLCDDPGLGKTITVLALILQSSTSERPAAVTRIADKHEIAGKEIHEEATHSPESGHHDTIFYAYWEEQVTKDFRVQDSLKLLNGFLRQLPDLIFPVKALRLAISNHKYGSDFRKFEVAVRSSIETSNDAPVVYLHLWECMVDEFKASQMRSVRRYFSNSASKPWSNVAALLDDENKERLGRSLIPSSSTLLVVPSVLLDHWKTQIELHVNWKYCTSMTPYTFEFCSNTSKKRLSEAMSVLEGKTSHSPVLFIDRAGTAKLPDAKFLAQFHVVITTTQRFKNEWKKGSFQEEIQLRNSGDASNDRHLAHQSAEGHNTSCELLKVHWKRMIVDEGHSMGNKGNAIQFASWIQASRRWVMTGTPTKQSGAEMKQLLNLLNFLQHGFFTQSLDGDAHWKRHIARDWTDGNLGSFFRLRLLLGSLMKRHTKLDIRELLPPEYETTKVSMSSLEVATYNTVVSGIQANIILTSMDAKTSGLQDSLLHRSQARNANLALLNIRRVCTGWSRVVPVLPDDHSYAQTIRLAEQFGFSSDDITNVKKYIHRAESEQQSECGVCAFRVPIHILMSCCGGLGKPRPLHCCYSISLIWVVQQSARSV